MPVFYLVQHAEVRSKEEDPERRLTENGRKQAAKLGEFLKKIKVKPDRILHSGKARAEETALIIAEKTGIRSVEKAEHLAPLDAPEKIAERIKKEKSSLIIVGHLPHLSKLSSLLLTGNKEPELIKFSYACCLAIVKEEEKFKVDFLIKQEML